MNNDAAPIERTVATMTTTPATPLETLTELRACDPALDWVRAQGVADMQALWERCDHGDWMLWLAARRGADRGPGRAALRRIAARCACLAVVTAVAEGERCGLDTTALRAAALAVLNAPSIETLLVLRGACEDAVYGLDDDTADATADAVDAHGSAQDVAIVAALSAAHAIAAAHDADATDACRLARMTIADIVRAEMPRCP